MTNVQLLLSIGIPTFTVICAALFSTSRIEGRLVSIEADLRRFYHDLGRHEADIQTLKERKA